MSDKKVTSTKQSVDTKIETRSMAVVKTPNKQQLAYEDGSHFNGDQERKTGDESSRRVPENRSVATRVHKVSSTDFALQALNAHNIYRKNHNVPSLVLSDDLCKQAQIWANKLVDEDDKSNGSVKSFYSKGQDGESVHYWPNPLATGKNIVDDWYSQIKQYDFDCPSHNDTSYFAQMVWKSTKELGFAKTQCKRGGMYIVANYRPRWGSGNFHENIPKPNKAWDYFDALNKAELPRCVVTTERKFLTDALKAFNDCRKKHRTPSVFLSDDLCEVAQMQANKIAAKNSMKSSDVPFSDYYGESRFWSSSSEVSGDSAVEKWYAGVENYKFESALDFQNDTGNFTQVEWKGTKDVGIAKAISENNETYVVAIYNPSGNVKGEFSSNVLNPWSQTPIAKLINSFQHK
ncbi:Golgi-associated plant pathogenesis-related protein 1 [Orchesella cincta]|uniref:Golgi-associated plant pathogenesis-related protein 1 n=1 Tax=Orchesella cincta TaxID=48709 RepID=A0A1D2MB31_ORCCI|nr:Golgi-associated plant pathogenesis-related protein 1 [Orchesella cincta]